MEQAAKRKIERLTFEALIKAIVEKFGGGEGVHLYSKDGLYHVAYEDSPNTELYEASGSTLFTAAKTLYRQLFGNPVVEVPNGYSQGATERVVDKLCSIDHNNYITVSPNKSGFTAMMWSKDVQQWAIGRGLTIHHALVFMHRNLAEIGVDIKI